MLILIRRFLICIIIILFVKTSLTAQVNSPYSRIGLGNIFPTTFSASDGMAGLSVAQFNSTDIQINNPASYSFLYKAVYDAGAYANYLQLKTSTEEFQSGNANLSNIAFGFSPDNKKSRHDFGFSTGLTPFSGFQYNIEQEAETDTIIGIQSTNYRGEGSLYQFYGGLGYSFDINYDSTRKEYRSTIGLGVNAAYLFGDLQNITVTSFPEATNSVSTKYVRDTEVGGGLYTAGLIYQTTIGNYDINKKKDTLYTVSFGASVSPPVAVNGIQSVGWFNVNKFETYETIIDTLLVKNDSSASIVMPAQFHVGLSFNNFRNGTQKTKFSVGTEFSTTLWSQFEGFQYTDSMANSYRLKIGSEIIPPRADRKREINYRIGFYYGKSNLIINNEQLSDFGMSFGVGLPVGNFTTVLSKVNVALTIGRRGTIDFIQENYLNLNVGLNLNDLSWFQRRQLN